MSSRSHQVYLIIESKPCVWSTQVPNDVEHMPMHIMLRQSFSVRHSAIASAWLQFLRGVRGITFKAANLAFSLLSFAM
jgi:hypothetical protein